MDAAVMRFVGVRAAHHLRRAGPRGRAGIACSARSLGAGLAWLAGAATNAYYRRYFDTELIFSPHHAEDRALQRLPLPAARARRPAPWRPGDWCAPGRWCSGAGHDGARLGPAQPRSPPAPHRARARRYRRRRRHAARHGDAERGHREVVQRAAPRARLSAFASPRRARSRSTPKPRSPARPAWCAPSAPSPGCGPPARCSAPRCTAARPIHS